MKSSLRIASLVACALSLSSLPVFAKGQPDWSNTSKLFSKKHRGAEVTQLTQADKTEVARRNGMTAEELVNHMKADKDLAIDQAGFLHYTCEGLAIAGGAETLTATGNTQYSAIPNSTDAFKLHSLPGASKVIYLDFTGHTTSGTYWNSAYTGGADIVSTPFDTDGSPSTFSSAEQDLIKKIWARVAEEYAAFQVDVTTEDPGVAALTKSGTTDTAYGIRVVISPSSAWYGNAGGVAYMSSFGLSADTPCFIFSNLLGPNNEKYVSDAIAHEVGHTLGLSHMGTTTGSAYYQGHGDWAPIMGVGYYKSITHFCKGEYANANNTEDELAIIASKGLVRNADDNGSTLDTATVLTGSTLFGLGVIETSSDVDVFRFDAGAGAVSLTVAGTSNQPNLDVVLQLVNSSGTVIASANPTGLSASLSATVTAGTYFIKVSGTGYADPATTGYSNYGSLGEYSISGTVPASTNVAPVAVASVSATSGVAPVTVSFNGSSSTDSDGVIASYSWNFGDGTTSTSASPVKTYSSAGTYNAILTVTDNGGLTSSSTPIAITVNAPANVAPTAVATSNVTSGYGPLTVSFNGSASTDSDGTIASYAWSFGDGSSSSVANPSKTYSVAGSYTAKLTVTDNRGASSTSTVTITVTQDPNKDCDVNALSAVTNKTTAGTAATASVRVLDRAGRPVTGATVTLTWTGTVTGTSSLSTDTNGYATFTSKRVKTSGSATATVKSVTTPSAYRYDSSVYAAATTASVTWVK